MLTVNAEQLCLERQPRWSRQEETMPVPPAQGCKTKLKLCGRHQAYPRKVPSRSPLSSFPLWVKGLVPSGFPQPKEAEDFSDTFSPITPVGPGNQDL